MHFHPRLFSNKSALKDIFGHGGFRLDVSRRPWTSEKRKNQRPSFPEGSRIVIRRSFPSLDVSNQDGCEANQSLLGYFPAPQSPKCSPRTNLDDDVFSSLAPCFPFLSPRLESHLTVIKLEISLTRAVKSSEIWDLYNPRFIQSYVNSPACKKMKFV